MARKMRLTLSHETLGKPAFPTTEASQQPSARVHHRAAMRQLTVWAQGAAVLLHPMQLALPGLRKESGRVGRGRASHGRTR